MAITFTWSVKELKRLASNDSITKARWLCSASETVGSGDNEVTHIARLGGQTDRIPDPSASDFIAYADVTEANVLNWVYNSLIMQKENGSDETAAEAKARTETELQAMFDEKKTPTTKTGVPW